MQHKMQVIALFIILDCKHFDWFLINKWLSLTEFTKTYYSLKCKY
jgi:hypothetical protein